MNIEKDRIKKVKQGVLASLPIVIGYFPIAMAFGLLSKNTDNKENINFPFVLTINILSYISWVLGTVAGYLVGQILPASLQSSLSIGLYAMFAALLFPEIKKSRNVLFLSIISSIVYLLLFVSKLFISGWDIIIGIIISSAIGSMVFNPKEEE
ncbi:hypothetical protein AAK964_11320 [Tissierella praeacuta]|uniref:hypothetical protein n=1 Tax=Tissierella praeacuta TaxID=43131 RepID=UPI0035127ADD